MICVLHGICYGLAIDLSCCADVRLAAADARLAVKEVDIGLAADIGTLSRLPRLVASASWVKDVCLTAREFGAPEALSVGFVSQVHPSKAAALDAAVAMAALLASKSPVAVQGTKELLNHARDHTVQDSTSPFCLLLLQCALVWSLTEVFYLGLRYTGIWNSASVQSSDVHAALMSGLKKTRPTFEKL